MRRSFSSLVCLAALFVCALPAPAAAQLPDAIGVRAQGMGGAFTAVADDATASWWNPAGVAAGAFLNIVVEYGQLEDPPVAESDSHAGFSMAFPALGFGYYRVNASQQISTGTPAAGRQDTGTFSVRSVDVSQFGATVGQSLGRHAVLASTLKLLTAAGDTDAGLDMGALVIYGVVRGGVMVRNVKEPSFGEGEAALTLKRQVRAGFAVSSATSTAFGGASIALDADVLDVPTALGDERRVAIGGELWTRTRWIGGRGGVSFSTIGESRRALSGGVSLAVRKGLFVEAQLTGGDDDLRKGWSTALRMTF